MINLKDVKRVAFFDWNGVDHVMDEDFTRKYIKLLELEEEILFKSENCRYEIKANKLISGQLIISGTKKISFKYLSGIFKKNKTLSINYPDITDKNLQGNKLIFESNMKKIKKITFTLPDNEAETAFNILKNTKDPEYVTLPNAIRSIRFLYE